MATKISAKELARLEAFGGIFKGVKTEEDAKVALRKFLSDNEVEGVENEPLKELISMAELFKPDGESEEEEEIEEGEAEEVEEEEEEEVAPVKKAAPKKAAVKKAAPVEEEEEPEEEEEVEEEPEEGEEELEEREPDIFDDMDRNALKAFKKENGIDAFKVLPSMTDDDIRDLLRENVSFEDEAAEEEEPEEAEEQEEEVEENEEEVAEESEEDEFDEMDRNALKAFKKENGIDSFKVTTNLTDDDIRAALRAALTEPDEEVEEEEEEEVAPVKAAPKKSGKKVVPETEEELDELAEEVEARQASLPKKAPVAVKEPKSGNSVPWTYITADDELLEQYIARFREVFPEPKYEIKIVKKGITVRVLNKNSAITILNYGEVKGVKRLPASKKDESMMLTGNMYVNRFKDVEDIEAYLPEEIQTEFAELQANGEPLHDIGMYRGEPHPCIRNVDEDLLFSLLEDYLLEESLKRAAGNDKKMEVNRKKLEESLAGKQEAPAKKTVVVTTVAKPAAKPVVAATKTVVKPAASKPPVGVAQKPVVAAKAVVKPVVKAAPVVVKKTVVVKKK